MTMWASVAVAQPVSTPEITRVVWKGKVFRKGDRVKIVKGEGFLKTVGNKPWTGTILYGVLRKPDPDNPSSFRSNEPLWVVMVRWDGQAVIGENDQPVRFGQRDWSIHVDYLEVIDRAKSPRPGSK